MFLPIRKVDPSVKIINNALYDLPAPLNLSIWWNFGSLLGLCLILQILTGVFLAIHYVRSVEIAFESASCFDREVIFGSLIRSIHANGGTFFFICLYLHVGRGIYYGSYLHSHTWNIGILILLLLIVTAFLGYVLPWGQISFWAATVITRMVSAIPQIGRMLATWLWGGFCVEEPTLVRFYALHFLLPFIIAAIRAIHIILLHDGGSNNPLGISRNSDKIPFHTYYTTKDFVGFIILLVILIALITLQPNLLIDPENFIPANPLVTPDHIQPEWYFLFAYAILRAAPNKLGGVIALIISVLILFTIPLTHIGQFRSCSLYPARQITFWIITARLAILTWIGACPIDPPFKILGAYITRTYFSFFILYPITQWIISLQRK